jgi:hypothetical protein
MPRFVGQLCSCGHVQGPVLGDAEGSFGGGDPSRMSSPSSALVPRAVYNWSASHTPLCVRHTRTSSVSSTLTRTQETGGRNTQRRLFDDLDFDFLHGFQSQDKLGGPQLGGAQPTWTQEEQRRNRSLATTRSERWDAARRVAAARRERWGATISRRVARVVPRGCKVGGGDGDTTTHY